MSRTVYCETAAEVKALPPSVERTAERATSLREKDELLTDGRHRRRIYRCRDCDFEITAWVEGFSCFQAPNGERHYFHRPDGLDREPAQSPQEARRKSGLGVVEWMRQCRLRCEHQYVCLSCRTVSLIDEVYDPESCPTCGSEKTVRAWDLDGNACPCCGGALEMDSRD